jgi:hypothetical protein
VVSYTEVKQTENVREQGYERNAVRKTEEMAGGRKLRSKEFCNLYLKNIYILIIL